MDQGEVERTRSGRAFLPRVDIYETNEAITVVCDMPGVDDASVDIALEQNILTINGYVNEQQPKDYTLAYAEYRVGDYYRKFTVSNQVDREGIEATMKDGVLKLLLPKAVPTTKKIAVKSA
ncbi:MAG: Hsp20/alpha crystallin family protein [Deltaproteobacteria bacterium]|nr:Hsp20/alpha crystallin family protein [Deltaproteobacteria bacterium]